MGAEFRFCRSDLAWSFGASPGERWDDACADALSFWRSHCAVGLESIALEPFLWPFELIFAAPRQRAPKAKVSLGKTVLGARVSSKRRRWRNNVEFIIASSCRPFSLSLSLSPSLCLTLYLSVSWLVSSNSDGQLVNSNNLCACAQTATKTIQQRVMIARTYS